MLSLVHDSDVGNASSSSCTHSPFLCLETRWQLVSSLIDPINFNGFVVWEIHQIFKATSFVPVYFLSLDFPGSKQDIYWSNHNKGVHVSLWMCWLGIMPIFSEMTRISTISAAPVLISLHYLVAPDGSLSGWLTGITILYNAWFQIT